MPTVLLTSWNKGIQKVELTKYLSKDVSLGLSAAKLAVDKIMDEIPVKLENLTEHDAKRIAERCHALGAVCEVIPS